MIYCQIGNQFWPLVTYSSKSWYLHLYSVSVIRYQHLSIRSIENHDIVKKTSSVYNQEQSKVYLIYVLFMKPIFPRHPVSLPWSMSLTSLDFPLLITLLCDWDLEMDLCGVFIDTYRFRLTDSITLDFIRHLHP